MQPGYVCHVLLQQSAVHGCVIWHHKPIILGSNLISLWLYFKSANALPNLVGIIKVVNTVVCQEYYSKRLTVKIPQSLKSQNKLQNSSSSHLNMYWSFKFPILRLFSSVLLEGNISWSLVHNSIVSTHVIILGLTGTRTKSFIIQPSDNEFETRNLEPSVHILQIMFCFLF